MSRATSFRAAALFGALLLVALMIMTASRAAFSDPTSNDANSVAVGTVILTDDAPNQTTTIGDGSGDPIIDVSNMAPGGSAQGCIDVIYQGSLDATTQMVEVNATNSANDLAQYLTLTVEYDTTAGEDCSTGSFTSDFSGTLDGYVGATDVSASSDDHAVTGGAPDDEIRYRITVDFADTTDNAVQGETVTFDLEWEAQST